MWKLLVLPYLEVPLASRLVKQGERARTWDAKLEGLGGMQGAAYTASPNSVYSNFGIASIATTRNSMAPAAQMVTGYGTFPLILVDRGAGLDWHRATASRPLMQNRLGCLEATRSSDAAVALKHSWDTKVTTSLAMLGGLGSLLGTFLTKAGKRSAFDAQVATVYSLALPADGQLLGEATPFAPAPSAEEVDALTAPGGLRDFTDVCPRVTPRLPPPLEFAETSREKTAFPSPSPSSVDHPFDHSIPWTKGFSGKAEDQTMDVKNGELLKFVWAGGHNVYLMKDKVAFDACDFSTGTDLGAASPVYYTMGATTTYFACQVGSHCSIGQKLSAVIAGGGTGGGTATSPSPSSATTTPSRAPSPTSTGTGTGGSGTGGTPSPSTGTGGTGTDTGGTGTGTGGTGTGGTLLRGSCV